MTPIAITQLDPQELHAITGKVLALLAEHVAAPDLVVVAALKAAANMIEESNNASFAAQLRAGMIQQYRRK